MMSSLFLALADGKLSLRTLQRETGFNFAPARDDRPFFFHFAFGIPAVVLAVLGLALISLTGGLLATQGPQTPPPPSPWPAVFRMGVRVLYRHWVRLHHD